MHCQRAPIAVTIATLVLVGVAYADEVEIIADSANVKIGDEVIAKVEKGERFQLFKRQGNWVAISVNTEQGQREGWVLASQVTAVLPPEIDENEPAPGPPVLFELAADVTQVSGMSTSATNLFFRLSITNQDAKQVSFDAADFELKLDGETVKPVTNSTRTNYSYHRVYSDPSSRSSQDAQSLDYLRKGTIAPHETARGWLRFEIPRFRQIGDLTAKEWILSATIAGKSLKLDLKKAEIAALAAKVRPSSYDASVRVIEIGSRLNVLNLGQFLDLMKPLLMEDSGCLIMPQDETCLFDSFVQREVQSATRSSNATVIFAGFPSTMRNRMGIYLGSSSGVPQFAPSEATAVMQLLGTRTGSGPVLAKHLNASSPEVRAAAARALGTHTAEAGVLEALLKAADNENPTVRASVVASLANAVDPKAVAAVVRAMSDPEASVRQSAARAAGGCKPEAVIEPLIALLDDAQSSVVVAACSSLGRLQAKAAAPRLQELQASEESALKLSAIDALKAMGVLSDVDAALAKLGAGRLSSTEFEVLAKAHDKRVVPRLLESMKYRGSDTSYVDQIARVLGQQGDGAAVEPLIDALEHGYSSSGEVARALGKLGDERAVKPLQDVLTRTANANSNLRLAAYEALLALDAPDIFQQVVDELKQDTNNYSVDQKIGLLGRSANERAIPVIEQYLDNQAHYRAAAGALVQIGTAEALAPIKKRLLTEDYQDAQTILSLLYQKRTPDAIAILQEATRSPNERVRSTAQNYANSLTQMLASEHRSRIQTLLNSQQWAAAGEAFQTAINDELKAVDISPARARGLAAFVSNLASSYRSVKKPDLADEQFEKTIEAVHAKVKAGAVTELSSQLAQLRNQRVLFAFEAGVPQQADKIMRSELDAAKKAFLAAPDDVDNVLRLANALDAKRQLVSRATPDDLAAARKEFLDFLFEQTKKHSNEERIIAAFVSGQIGCLNPWSRSDPPAAGRQLTLVQDFLNGLNSNDAAITKRVENAKRSLASLELTINHWKTRMDMEARAVADLQKEGGKILAVGAKSSWSPDGKKIAFGKMPFGAGIQILDRETGKITDLLASGKDVAWSPDGRFIAYVAEPSLNAYQSESVWLVKPNGDDPRRIADGGFPTWSSDGKTLFVHSRKERALLAFEVDALQIKGNVILPEVWAYYPAVSPDRKRVAFGLRNQLVVVDLATRKTLVTWPTPGHRGLLPAWAPDGQWVAFGGFDNSESGIWALDVDAQQAVQVAKGPYTMPAWSRDGKQLAFDRRSSSAHEVWMLDTSIFLSRKRLSREQAASGFEGDAAKLAMSTNNLKAIGLAMHNFHDTHQCLPPAVIFGPDGKPWHSWRVLLLPFLDEADLYRRYRFDEPWDGPHNSKLLAEMPRVYRDPVYGESDDYYTHYAVPTGDAVAFAKEGIKMQGDGKNGFGSLEGAKSFKDFRDGTSNSLLAGLVGLEHKIPWMKPEDVVVGEGALDAGDLGGFAAPHVSEQGRAGVFLLADGSVRVIRRDVDPSTFRALLTIAGAEIIRPF